MKLGFTKGLFGVLVAVSCGFPSIVFGQQKQCDETMVWPVLLMNRDVIESDWEEQAVLICMYQLNERCQTKGQEAGLQLTIDSASIKTFTKQLNPAIVSCGGFCRCKP